MRVVKSLNGLPREAVKFPSLEAFKTHLYKTLVDLTVKLPGFEQGGGLDDLQGSLSDLNRLHGFKCQES